MEKISTSWARLPAAARERSSGGWTGLEKAAEIEPLHILTKIGWLDTTSLIARETAVEIRRASASVSTI